ncbi:trypsin-like serine protease [Streptomyces coeruleorubidus]|uniref:Trypsin-like serine protease n=1 Tax=Streptomyces coeruleorubidus TaxID=116188 RepID=A0ABZ0KQQ8_STRC4|nr:trypsin-like serine protease [Streptomyces coeruleorubidus]WOT40241.1 trypsin-like serine protease [Streptomyces coeruleorubidus]
MPGGGRHRRRIRIALPVAAAGVAAAVAAALLTTSAGAATALPQPTIEPAVSSPSLAELEKRVAGAMAGDDTAGRTSKASLSASTNTSPSTIDPKVIGGNETTITSAPWMTQLHYYDDRGTSSTGDDIGFFCGGAVVAPTKILTAAHCVKGYDWHANGAVVTGTSQLPSADGTDLHGGTVTGVWRQWNHPSYNATTIDNDIAVLTLPVPVKATPIRMTTSGDTTSYQAGTSAKVYGWGRTSSTSDAISETLKTATLPVQSDTTCAGAYGSDFVKGHMVCAGNPATGSDTGTTSACNGDSGGPLVVNNRIVGVVSWGVTDCVAKGAYSVFSKVSSYVGATYPRVDDTNVSGDHKADLWVRNASTKTGYSKDSKGTSFAARESWGNWNGVNVVLQTDFDRDGYQDLVYRRSSDGDLFWTHYVISSGTWSTKQIADNWSTRTRIITPGDVTGDYLPDLLSVDSAGVMWIYPGKGNGTFAPRVKVGSGWNQYNSVRGKGDFTGDGKTDLIARSKTGGTIYLYKGTGKAGSGAFSSRVKVRTWSSTTYNAFDATGDITGDGKADFLARTPGGTLYLYKGTGKATSEIFATRISVGTDFKQYDIFG